MGKTTRQMNLYMVIFLCFVSSNLYCQEFKFPIKVSENRRYFVDQNGKPFFYAADTGWKLFLRLNKKETLKYLATRKAQGFTVIQVMLTGFVGDSDVDGLAPFQDPNNFETYNQAYFNKVEEVIAMADSLNLIMAIAPLWAGCCGEGFAGSKHFMIENGNEKSEGFGKYLGVQFGKYNNIFWIIGGDNDPGNSLPMMDALAKGLKAKAPNHLVTYHAASTHSSTDILNNPSWLDYSMIYSYFRGFNKAWNKKQPDVYEVGFAEYQKTPVLPFILGESTYEGEHGEWGSALQVRKQAYWAVFSGGTGHAYGSDNWKIPSNWEEILEYPGANSLGNLRKLLYSKSWEKLQPDIASQLIEKGAGPYAANDFAISTIASDKTFAFCYLPSKREVSINLGLLEGKKIKASWFNPITGEITDLGNYSQNKNVTLTPPGDQDWVLILESN